MDKNTIWGFILMALVVFGFTYFNRPSEEELQARMAEQEEALAMEREMNKAKEEAPIDLFEKDNIFEAYDTSVILSNDLLSIELSSHGGKISSAVLKNYHSFATGDKDTALVDLVHKNASEYGFVFTTASRRYNTSDYYFTPNVVNDSTVDMTFDFSKVLYADKLMNGSIRYSLQIDSIKGTIPTSTFTLRYTLPKGSYIVNMEILQSGMENLIPTSTVSADFNWNYKMARNETGRTFEENRSSLTYKFLGDSPDDMSSTGNDDKSLRQRVKWIAFKNQFFSVIMLPRNSFNGAELKSSPLKQDTEYLKEMDVNATLDYSSLSPNPISIDLFFGPNLYPLLNSLDDELETQENLQLTRLIPLGWPIVRWISTLIIIPTFTWLGSFITNYGIIILILTVLLKIILFPISYKSFISQAKMRVLQPEIKEINEKYPGQQNAMTRQQKTMQLYSRAGASPMSGCIPMLLQMPILVAMFWFFPSCIELRGQSFLWAHNLAAPDIIATLPFTIPFYGNHVSLFCLIMTAVNIVFTRMNMQNSPSQASMPGMKLMMYLMPVMFLFFFNDYASSLSYYYLLSMLITIIITLIFRACIDENKLRQKLLAKAAKPAKKSKWMERLEEAQRRQQAMLREQQKRR